MVCSVYSGHQSILIPPVELETNPALWLLAVSQLRVRDTFCSYSVMELCTKGLGLQTDTLKVRMTQNLLLVLFLWIDGGRFLNGILPWAEGQKW